MMDSGTSDGSVLRFRNRRVLMILAKSSGIRQVSDGECRINTGSAGRETPAGRAT
jgi:hypothetical protein